MAISTLDTKMDIQTLYQRSDDLVARAFEDLQAAHQSLIPELQDPEVLPDDVYCDWLATNYLMALGFREDGRIIMAEIGGIIPTHPANGKSILATAEASIDKAQFGIYKIGLADETGDESHISELETATELPLVYRGDVAVVNGNRNIAHYDFVSAAARETPLDTLTTDKYILMGLEDGIAVLSNRCIEDGRYIFNVVLNPELVDRLRGCDEEDKFGILRESRDLSEVPNTVAGIRVTYKSGKIYLAPVISRSVKKTNAAFFREHRIAPRSSDIGYIGMSDPHGGFGIAEQGILGAELPK